MPNIPDPNKPVEFLTIDSLDEVVTRPFRQDISDAKEMALGDKEFEPIPPITDGESCATGSARFKRNFEPVEGCSVMVTELLLLDRPQGTDKEYHILSAIWDNGLGLVVNLDNGDITADVSNIVVEGAEQKIINALSAVTDIV